MEQQFPILTSKAILQIYNSHKSNVTVPFPNMQALSNTSSEIAMVSTVVDAVNMAMFEVMKQMQGAKSATEADVLEVLGG